MKMDGSQVAQSCATSNQKTSQHSASSSSSSSSASSSSGAYSTAHSPRGSSNSHGQVCLVRASSPASSTFECSSAGSTFATSSPTSDSCSGANSSDEISAKTTPRLNDRLKVASMTSGRAPEADVNANYCDTFKLINHPARLCLGVGSQFCAQTLRKSIKQNLCKKLPLTGDSQEASNMSVIREHDGPMSISEHRASVSKMPVAPPHQVQRHQTLAKIRSESLSASVGLELRKVTRKRLQQSSSSSCHDEWGSQRQLSSSGAPSDLARARSTCQRVHWSARETAAYATGSVQELHYATNFDANTWIRDDDDDDDKDVLTNDDDEQKSSHLSSSDDNDNPAGSSKSHRDDVTNKSRQTRADTCQACKRQTSSSRQNGISKMASGKSHLPPNITDSKQPTNYRQAKSDNFELRDELVVKERGRLANGCQLSTSRRDSSSMDIHSNEMKASINCKPLSKPTQSPHTGQERVAAAESPPSVARVQRPARHSNIIEPCLLSQIDLSSRATPTRPSRILREARATGSVKSEDDRRGQSCIIGAAAFASGTVNRAKVTRRPVVGNYCDRIDDNHNINDISGYRSTGAPTTTTTAATCDIGQQILPKLMQARYLHSCSLSQTKREQNNAPPSKNNKSKLPSAPRCAHFSLQHRMQQQQQPSEQASLGPRPPRLVPVPPPVIPLYKELALKRQQQLSESRQSSDNLIRRGGRITSCEEDALDEPALYDIAVKHANIGPCLSKEHSSSLSTDYILMENSRTRGQAANGEKSTNESRLFAGHWQHLAPESQSVVIEPSSTGASLANFTASCNAAANEANDHDDSKTSKPTTSDGSSWRIVKNFSKRLLGNLLLASSSSQATLANCIIEKTAQDGGKPAAKLHHEKRMRKMLSAGARVGARGRGEAHKSEESLASLNFCEPLYDTPELNSSLSLNSSPTNDDGANLTQGSRFDAGRLITGEVSAGGVAEFKSHRQSRSSTTFRRRGSRRQKTWRSRVDTPILRPLRAPAAVRRALQTTRPSMPPPPPPPQPKFAQESPRKLETRGTCSGATSTNEPDCAGSSIAQSRHECDTDEEVSAMKSSNHSDKLNQREHLAPETHNKREEELAPHSLEVARVISDIRSSSSKTTTTTIPSYALSLETRALQANLIDQLIDRSKRIAGQDKTRVVARTTLNQEEEEEEELRRSQDKCIQGEARQVQSASFIKTAKQASETTRSESQARYITPDQLKLYQANKRITATLDLVSIGQDDSREEEARVDSPEDLEDQEAAAMGSSQSTVNSASANRAKVRGTAKVAAAADRRRKSSAASATFNGTDTSDQQVDQSSTTTPSKQLAKRLANELLLKTRRDRASIGLISSAAQNCCSKVAQDKQAGETDTTDNHQDDTSDHTSSSTANAFVTSPIKQQQQQDTATLLPRLSLKRATKNETAADLVELGELIEQSDVFIHPKAQIEQHEQFWQDCIEAKRSKRREEAAAFEDNEQADLGPIATKTDQKKLYQITISTTSSGGQVAKCAPSDAKNTTSDSSEAKAEAKAAFVSVVGLNLTTTTPSETIATTTIIPIQATAHLNREAATTATSTTTSSTSSRPVQPERTLSGKRRDFLANRTTINLINSSAGNSSTATTCSSLSSATPTPPPALLVNNSSSSSSSSSQDNNLYSPLLGFEAASSRQLQLADSFESNNKDSIATKSSEEQQQDHGRCLSSLSMALSVSLANAEESVSSMEDVVAQATTTLLDGVRQISIKESSAQTIITTSCNEPLVVTTSDIAETVLVEQLAAGSLPEPDQQMSNLMMTSAANNPGANGAGLESPKRSIFDGASKDQILEYLEDARERVPEVLMAADDVMVLSENELIVVNQLDPDAPATPISIVELSSTKCQAAASDDKQQQQQDLGSLVETSADCGQIVSCTKIQHNANEAISQQQSTSQQLININLIRPKSEIDISKFNGQQQQQQQAQNQDQHAGFREIRLFHQQKNSYSSNNEKLLQPQDTSTTLAFGGSQETMLSSFLASYQVKKEQLIGSRSMSNNYNVNCHEGRMQMILDSKQEQSETKQRNNSVATSASSSDACYSDSSSSTPSAECHSNCDNSDGIQVHADACSSASSSASASPSTCNSSSGASDSTTDQQCKTSCPLSGANSGYNSGSSLSSSSPLLLLLDDDQSATTTTTTLEAKSCERIATAKNNCDFAKEHSQNSEQSSEIIIGNNNKQDNNKSRTINEQQQSPGDDAGALRHNNNNRQVSNGDLSCIVGVNNNGVDRDELGFQRCSAVKVGGASGYDDYDDLSAAIAPAGDVCSQQSASGATGDYCLLRARHQLGVNNKEPAAVNINDATNYNNNNNPTTTGGKQHFTTLDTNNNSDRQATATTRQEPATTGFGDKQPTPPLSADSARHPQQQQHRCHANTSMNRLNYYLLSRQLQQQQQPDSVELQQNNNNNCQSAASIVPLLMRRRQRGGSDSPSFGRDVGGADRAISASKTTSDACCLLDASKIEFQCPDCDQFLDLSQCNQGTLGSSSTSVSLDDERLRMSRVFELLDDLQQLQASSKQPITKNYLKTNYQQQLTAGSSYYADQLERAYIAAINGLPLCKICEKKRSERKAIIWEFVETELKYGRDLKIIHDEFMRPMQVAGLLTKDQIQGIFLNLDELIQANGRFAAKLEQALDKAQKIGDFDLNSICLGRVFIESSEMLHSFESYCVRQSAAACLLARLAKEKDLLRIFLRVSQMENTLLRRMNLAAFLVVPVQRVTRYPLLLNRLYKVTAYHHKDRESLRDAQLRVELHLDHINRQTKDMTSNKIWRRISNLSGGPMGSSMSSHSSLGHSLNQASSMLSSGSANGSNSANGTASSSACSTSSSLAAQRRALMMNTDDIDNIKLRKTALDILRWDRDETHFIHSGILHFTQLNEFLVKQKMKSLRYMPANALLIVLGKPNGKYRPELIKPTLDNRLMRPEPAGCGIRDAVLMLFREKNGRFVLSHEPLSLSNCVLSNDCSQFNSESPAPLSAPPTATGPPALVAAAAAAPLLTPTTTAANSTTTSTSIIKSSARGSESPSLSDATKQSPSAGSSADSELPSKLACNKQQSPSPSQLADNLVQHQHRVTTPAPDLASHTQAGGPKRTGSAGSCGTPGAWRQDCPTIDQQRRTNSYNEGSTNKQTDCVLRNNQLVTLSGSSCSSSNSSSSSSSSTATTTTRNQFHSDQSSHNLQYSHHFHNQQAYGVYEESFELHERLTKESLLIRADTPLKTRYWLQMLRYHAKDLGQWRQRRPGLANIMMMRREQSS